MPLTRDLTVAERCGLLSSAAPKSAGYFATASGWQFGQRIVQYDVQQGSVNPDAAVIVDETQLPEAVHEEADPAPGRPDHLREGLLSDRRNQHLGFPRLTILGHQEENPRQPL